MWVRVSGMSKGRWCGSGEDWEVRNDARCDVRKMSRE